MALLHSYQILVGPEGTTPAQVVTPINDRLIKEWEKQDGTRAFRQIIKTPLVFIKDDFDLFFGAGSCTIFEIDILRKETGASDPFTGWYSGTLNTGDVKHDPARGICEITVQPKDGFTCFYKNMKNKVNILGFGRPIRLTNEAVQYEEVTCSNSVSGVVDGTHIQDCIVGGAAAGYYVMTEHREALIFPGEIIADTVWKREKWGKVSPPPNDGTWNEIIGVGYFRAPLIVGEVTSTTGTASYWYNAQVTSFLDQDGVDNGRELAAIFDDMFDGFGCAPDLRVKSDFLNIHFVGDAPSNAAYSRAAERLNELLVFQRSDIMKWDADQNASILETSVEDFINIFVKLFNMAWTITRSGAVDYFVLEHISFFDSIVQNDFSASKYLRKHEAFDQRLEDYPKNEYFELLSGRKLTRFGPAYMEYTGCITPKAQSSDHIFANLSTDFVGMIINNDPNDNMEGFFLMSCFKLDDFFSMYQDYGLLNGPLSNYEIIKYYWRHNIHGDFTLKMLNGLLSESLTATTQKKKKKQPAVSVVVERNIELLFDAGMQQETAVGAGEVQSAQYDTRTGAITLQLLS